MGEQSRGSTTPGRLVGAPLTGHRLAGTPLPTQNGRPSWSGHRGDLRFWHEPSIIGREHDERHGSGRIPMPPPSLGSFGCPSLIPGGPYIPLTVGQRHFFGCSRSRLSGSYQRLVRDYGCVPRGFQDIIKVDMAPITSHAREYYLHESLEGCRCID